MPTPVDHVTLRDRPTDWIESEVMKLSGQIAAATCRFLLLISELDRRAAHLAWEARSMAHWVAWKCAVELNTARDQVRVARALRDLPVITEHFSQGQLSYSKVRALTRIATPETEHELVDLARHATAAQLDKVVRSYGRIQRNVDPDRARAQLEVRGVHIDRNEDGTATLHARLTPESIARLELALDAALRDAPPSADRTGDTIQARRADALDAIVTQYLEPDPAAAPRTELLIHADLPTLVDGSPGRGETASGTPLATETLLRLACDCGIRLSIEDGVRVIDVSARRRTGSPALRRAIETRDDHRCRFPGCPVRHRLRIHHLHHYARGGETVIVNLILLCPTHHRAVHEGGWTVRGNANEPLVFVDPRGRPVPEIEPLRERADAHDIGRAIANAGVAVRPDTIRSLGEGESMDLDWTMAAVCSLLPPDPN